MAEERTKSVLQEIESRSRTRAEGADWRLTSAEILYNMPDHPGVLNTFIWQKLDRAPVFPELTRFLEFWRREIEGPLHPVRVASAALIRPAELATPTGSSCCTDMGCTARTVTRRTRCAAHALARTAATGRRMRIACSAPSPMTARSFEAANAAHGHELSFPRAAPDRRDRGAGRRLAARLRLRQRRPRRRGAGGAGGRGHAAGRAALRRLQQRGPRGGRPARPRRRAGAGLLAACGGGAHRRPDPDAQAQDPPRLQPGRARATSPSTGCSASTCTAGRSA